MPTPSLATSTHLRSGRAKPIARRSTVSNTAFEFGDVVWVPFPFVEAPRLRDRPSVVVAEFRPAAGMHLLWVLMITSAENAGWNDDLSLERDYRACGLDVPCIIRTAKIATVDGRRARSSGTLTEELRGELRRKLQAALVE